jgi:hypothetical protein
MVPIVAQQHAFDLLAVGQSQEQLLGAVLSPPVGNDPASKDAVVLGELAADQLGQVGHLLEPIGAPPEHPLPYLPCPKPWQAALGQPGLEPFGRLIQQMEHSSIINDREATINPRRFGRIGLDCR